MSRKAIKKSVRQSVEYSIALFFVVLFLVSNLYGVPNTQIKSSDQKNSNAIGKLDGSYKRYCIASDDDDEGLCKYVALNTDALVNAPIVNKEYQIFTGQTFITDTWSSQLIRAPPSFGA